MPADKTGITEDELARLVRMVLPPEGMLEDDIIDIMQWADRVRIENALLDGVLSGSVRVRVRAGDRELVFSRKISRRTAKPRRNR